MELQLPGCFITSLTSSQTLLELRDGFEDHHFGLENSHFYADIKLTTFLHMILQETCKILIT